MTKFIGMLALCAFAGAVSVQQDSPTPAVYQRSQMPLNQDQGADLYSKYKRAVVLPETYNPYWSSVSDGTFPYWSGHHSAPLMIPQNMPYMHMAFIPVPQSYPDLGKPRAFSAYSEPLKNAEETELIHAVPLHHDADIFSAGLRTAPQIPSETSAAYAAVPFPVYFPYSQYKK